MDRRDLLRSRLVAGARRGGPQQPADMESILASAQQAQARGDFVAAAGFFRTAVSLQPDLAELRANLGLMDYQTGNHEEAIASFQQAIRLNPVYLSPVLPGA